MSEAELFGAFVEAGEAEIAPDAQLLAEGPEIEPAVAVVIDGAKRVEICAGGDFDFVAAAAVETDGDAVRAENCEIGAEIVIEIAVGERGARDPVGQFDWLQGAAALFFEEEGRGVTATDNDIHVFVAIPAFHRDVLGGG